MGVSAFHRTYWDGRAYRKTKIFQRDHRFLFGDVVRWTGSEWVLASAASVQEAEALGIVSHSGYRGEDLLSSSEDYARRVLPSFAFSNQTKTEEQCNDPRHYFSVVFRGEITIPEEQDINYSRHALLSGTTSTPNGYLAGTVYYLSPFEGEEGKLISKSPLEFGGKMAHTVVKPMLVTLDGRKAVVVNYVGSVLESDPSEWAKIDRLQKVGAVGAFLENNLPDSWIACDGRLCTSAQYPQLAETIGGSVRVLASIRIESNPPQAGQFTAISDYAILDFSEENIDVSAAVVGEPLNIRLESNNSLTETSVLIDGVVNSRRLRVIVNSNTPLPGTPGWSVSQWYRVKVRAPYNPGIDSQFFVPNLRERTIRGADPISVFENTDRQSDLGDFSGSNTATLNAGSDISSGTGYSATVDTRADAVKLIFAIKTNNVDCGSFINECCSPINPVGQNDNAIINGAFLVWQRGKEFARETFDAQPQYTADRWFEDFSIPAPIRPPLFGEYHVLKRGVKKTICNPGSANYEPGVELPDDITTYAQVQGTLMNAVSSSDGNTEYSVSTSLLENYDQQSYHYLENRIEDARTMSGEDVTLSFWARGTEPGSIHVALRQHFAGTRGILDDAYSNPVEIELDGTRNWNRYEISLSIPDVQETKPSDGYLGANSFLGVQFWTMYFAGACVGTPNPIVYDSVIMPTPGPEGTGIPLPVREGQALQEDGGYYLSKEIVDEIFGKSETIDDVCRVAVAIYKKCCRSLCAPCGNVLCRAPMHECCSGWVLEELDSSGRLSATPCSDVEIHVGLYTCIGSCTNGGSCVCKPNIESYNKCCGTKPPPPTFNSPPQPCLCLCGQFQHPPVTTIPIPISGDIVCFNFDLSHPSSRGGCRCSGGGYSTREEFANAMCSCCACGDNEWGCLDGGGSPTPTNPTTPPPPTDTETPPPTTEPPTPSESGPTVSASGPQPTVPPTPPPTPPQTPTPTPSFPTTEPPFSQSPTVIPPSPSPSREVGNECVTNCCLPVLFNANFNYKGILHITGVQLIRGNSAKPFEETDDLDELKKCQRYYEKDQHVPIGGSTRIGVSAQFHDSVNYMVPKRRLKAPCVHIQGHYPYPGAHTVCSLNTVDVDCFNDESAVFVLSATPTQSELGLCAALIEYEIDADLYESPCPSDPPGGITARCGWEEVS